MATQTFSFILASRQWDHLKNGPTELERLDWLVETRLSQPRVDANIHLCDFKDNSVC